MTQRRTAPRVTVIMPAYNAEKYLERSVRSVLGQSFRELELIVSNDGSKDATGEILERLAAEDARLRPITAENGGPAAARNRALDALDADTDYVMFIDSDDELLPAAVEYAVAGAESGAELTVFGFSIVGVDGRARDYSEPERFYLAEELRDGFARLYKANLLNQVWGKLYRASLLRERKARFQDYRWGEDRLFIFDCLEEPVSVRVLPECKYRYIMHEGESLITRYYDKKFSVCLEIDRRVEALSARLGLGDEADFRYMFAKSVFSCLTNLYSASCRLSGAEKRAVVAEIIGNERVKRRCRDASGGLPTAVLCAVLRRGSVGLNMRVFRLVALAGERAPRLFLRLKHRK